MNALKGLFFDQDGVIVDTERDGHRVAFNRTFEEFGLPFRWDEETYGRLLAVGGGKERLRHYLSREAPEMLQRARDAGDDLIGRVHRRKTEVFVELIQNGSLPLRPGVKRLMKEANEHQLTVGICTTSNQRAAEALVQTMLSDIDLDFVLAGDVVSRKKPDPEIYRLACETSGLDPAECCAIEDSANGVTAARAAGLHVVATVNRYTRDDNLDEAVLVLSCLGDPGGETAEVLQGPADSVPGGYVTLPDIEKLIESSS